jgi:hypothetical protein
MSLRDTPKHEKAPKFRRESWPCRNIGVFSEQDSIEFPVKFLSTVELLHILRNIEIAISALEKSIDNVTCPCV